jgi:hypothetical protein
MQMVVWQWVRHKNESSSAAKDFSKSNPPQTCLPMRHIDGLMMGTRVEVTFWIEAHRITRGCRQQSRCSGAAEIHGVAFGAGSSKAWQLRGTGSAARRGAGAAACHGVGARGGGGWRWSRTLAVEWCSARARCWRRAVALWFLLYDISVLYASDEWVESMGEERNRPAADNQMGLESNEPCPNNVTVNANGPTTWTLQCICIFLSNL